MSLALAAYRDRAAQTPPLVLSIAGVTVALHASEADIRQDSATYFRPLVADAAPAFTIHAVQGSHDLASDRLVDVPVAPGRSVKEAVCEDPEGRVIYKRRTGVGMVLRPDEAFILGDLRANLNQVHNLVGHVLARAFLQQGYCMLHASAVATAARGFAFGARSGGGKSTAALGLMERGARFVSNDRLFLRATPTGVEMLGMPKWPRVNPGTLLRLPSLRSVLPAHEQATLEAMPPQDLWHLEQKHDVDVHHRFGETAYLFRPTPLHGLYLLDWSLQGSGLQVAELPDGTRLAELRPLVKGLGVYGNSPEIEASAEAALVAVAERLPLYSVRGFADALRLAEDLAGLGQPA